MEGGLESPKYVSTVEVQGKDDTTHWEGVKSEQMKPWDIPTPGSGRRTR